MNASAVDAVARSDQSEYQSKRHRTQTIHPHGATDDVGGLVVKFVFGIEMGIAMLGHRGVIYVLSECWRGKRPHRKESKPTEELYHTQLPHDSRHGFEVLGNFYESVKQPAAFCILLAEGF